MTTLSSSTPGPLSDPLTHARLRESVLEHLWQRVPNHCVILTDLRLRPAIDVAITRAARHGFYEPAQVRPFTVMMVMLGSHFDEDPFIPWAGEHLRRSARATRRHAIADLLATVSQHLEPLVGRHGEYYHRSLAWIGARTLDALAGTYAGDDEGLRLFVRHLYRRKHDGLGPVGVARVLHEAHAMAQRHGLITPEGTLVMVGLVLLLGWGVDRDPFHPWVDEILSEPSRQDPETRARRLYARALEVLARYSHLDALIRHV
ncbi:MAG: hypothetical protein AB1Z98_12785 [Nannocystaceae bacterium]